MKLDTWTWAITTSEDYSDEQLENLAKKLERLNDKIDELIRQELERIDPNLTAEIR